MVNCGLHYSLVRGLSLSWRSLLAHSCGSYSPLPQEVPHYPSQALLARGVGTVHCAPTTLLTVLAATSNLPLLTPHSLLGRHLKLHSFLTAHSPALSSPSTNITAAWGVGLLARIVDFGRFELNYCVPLTSSHPQRPGLSFSFGTEWL